MRLRPFVSDDGGYKILISVLMFAMMLIALNWFYMDNMMPQDMSVQDRFYAQLDPEANFTEDPIGWLGDRVEDFAPFQMLTFNLPILEPLGFIGILIRTGVMLMIIVGTIDLIWL